MDVVYLCSFDIGNALADHVASGENHFYIKDLFKKLFSSIPFDVYIIIFILAIFKLQIPTPILNIASTIGAGNSFLAMLMIGMMLEVKVSPHETKNIMKVIGLRLSTPILNIASTIGAGNSFLAMLMIGMMLEVKVSPHETKNIMKVIGLRLSGTIILSLITYFYYLFLNFLNKYSLWHFSFLLQQLNLFLLKRLVMKENFLQLLIL